MVVFRFEGKGIQLAVHADENMHVSHFYLILFGFLISLHCDYAHGDCC